MALVKFVAGTAAQFQDLSPKDANTLYFITDERRIYKAMFLCLVVFTRLLQLFLIRMLLK